MTCAQNIRLKKKIDFNKLIEDGGPTILHFEQQNLCYEIPNMFLPPFSGIKCLMQTN